jgi:hypothetical protein
MKTFAFFAFSACAVAAHAETVIQDGTKLRVRLDQTISSATADEGQSIELSVTEPVKVGEVTVIPEGARVTGTITQAQEKRRMGRAGHLDFSIDRVRVVDGEWLRLRYTVTKKSGDSHAVRTGVVTAGVAAVFWPAAPVFLLMKGKDTTINKGVVFDVFTDQNHTVAPMALSEKQPNTVAPAPAGMATRQGSSGAATVTITSTHSGAEIDIDGSFVGSTPTTVQLSAGQHQITVTSGAGQWERTLQVNGGSNININADPKARTVAASR